MASPRSTPFIASWDSGDLQDATAPLDEIVAVERLPAPAPDSSRRAWSVIGVAAVLAAGALIWAAEGKPQRTSAIARPTHTPPPRIHAALQAFPVRIDSSPPDIAWPDEAAPGPSPRAEPPPPSRPARATPQPRDELAAALLDRRKQLSRMGVADADVDAVAAIHFDPSRRSARVVYRLEHSSAELVEYWALRDGRWQPLGD